MKNGYKNPKPTTDLIDSSIIRRQISADYSSTSGSSTCTVDIGVSYDGYTAFGIIGINGVPTAHYLRGFMLTSTSNARIYLNCDSQASGTINIHVLYKKNT